MRFESGDKVAVGGALTDIMFNLEMNLNRIYDPHYSANPDIARYWKKILSISNKNPTNGTSLQNRGALLLKVTRIWILRISKKLEIAIGFRFTEAAITG